MKFLCACLVLTVPLLPVATYAEDATQTGTVPPLPPPPPHTVYVPANPTSEAASAPIPTAPVPANSPPAPAAEAKTEAPQKLSDPHWIQIQAAAGIATPSGGKSGADGDGMGQSFGPQIPVQAGVGGKPIPHLYLGVFGSLAIGTVGAQGCVLSRCTTTAFRFGLEAQLHFLPKENINPWLGYGAGFELQAVPSRSPNDVLLYSSTGRNDYYSGWNFAILSGGIDFRVSNLFAVGPYLSASLGQFSSYDSSGKLTADISNKAVHQWYTLGARFAITP